MVKFLDLNEIQEMTETDDYADNLNKIRELSRQVKILDLLDPTSRIVNILTEIVERSRHIPELEMVERKIMNIDAPPLLGIAPGEDRLSQIRKAAHACLCCATITCSDNWGPCHNLKDVLHEIYFNWQKTKYYRLMCLIKKVLNEKIGTCVPVHEFLLPPSFGDVYYKFHNLG